MNVTRQKFFGLLCVLQMGYTNKFVLFQIIFYFFLIIGNYLRRVTFGFFARIMGIIKIIVHN